jgi:hypothetical protein
MFNKRDPRAWGNAAASGAVPGLSQEPEMKTIQRLNGLLKDGRTIANIPGCRGFRNVRQYREGAIYQLGCKIIGRA